MKDSFTQQRSGRDVLLQEIPEGFVGYRLLRSAPPTGIDFQSAYELGKWPTPGKPYRSYAWFGVSLFEDRAKVERFANTAKRKGQTVWIAELVFPADTGLYGIYQAKTTHLEVFGFPHELQVLIRGYRRA